MRPKVMMLVMIAACCASSAHAAPPTVVPSPGYDARLQEQRDAMSARPSGQVTPVTPRTKPRHHKRHPRQ